MLKFSHSVGQGVGKCATCAAGNFRISSLKFISGRVHDRLTPVNIVYYHRGHIVDSALYTIKDAVSSL
jgi:hypothetical protein